MEIDYQKLRLEGVYKQNSAEQLMQRIKLIGGLISVEQARAVSRLGDRYGSGILHLTTRGSLELHHLEFDDLPAVHRELARVGLYTRGACGGAVRGISCGSGFGRGFEKTQVLTRNLLNHFSNNPHFEGLPKKFKIAVESGYQNSRHLIQDLGLVFVDEDTEDAYYDVWMAGGLGREPQAAFLYQRRIPESRVLVLAESLIRLFQRYGKQGRRLKHLLNEIGEKELRKRLELALADAPALIFASSYSKVLQDCPENAEQLKIRIPIRAGELPSAKMELLAEVVSNHGVNYLLMTSDQDVEFLVKDLKRRKDAVSALLDAGFAGIDEGGGALRVCPGNHECSMGLAATRDLAKQLVDDGGKRLSGKSIAISGCANSCAQPQLADIGIVASKFEKMVDGERRTLFDVYIRKGEDLGKRVREKIPFTEVQKYIRELV